MMNESVGWRLVECGQSNKGPNETTCKQTSINQFHVTDVLIILDSPNIEAFRDFAEFKSVGTDGDITIRRTGSDLLTAHRAQQS